MTTQAAEKMSEENQKIIANPDIGFHWVERTEDEWVLASKPLPEAEALPYVGQKGIALTENLRSALEAEAVNFTLVGAGGDSVNNMRVFIISEPRTLGTKRGANDIATIVGLEEKPVAKQVVPPATGKNSAFNGNYDHTAASRVFAENIAAAVNARKEALAAGERTRVAAIEERLTESGRLTR